VQLQHQAEELLADGFGQYLPGVGVEGHTRPAALARWRRKKGGAGAVVAAIEPQAGDPVGAGRLDPGDQFGRLEPTLLAALDLPALGIQGAGDLTLEAVEGTGDAHDGQHQTGADAEEPVQLEDDFLEHDGATSALTHCDGRLLYMGIIFITIHLRVIYASAQVPRGIARITDCP